MKLFVIVWILTFSKAYGGGPCAGRSIPGQSVVCVCNVTYCDSIIRDGSPERGSYVAYTTSKSGLRFAKSSGIWNDAKVTCPVSLHLDPEVKYQTIEGFGGAVTDAAGINWKSLPEGLQDDILMSYFSEVGLEYNMMRVPIGGSDFSTHAYAYNELPENDVQLSNFTLAPEDFNYKIPMIKKAMSYSQNPIHIVATTWSPPLWMKTSNSYGGISRLKEEYYQTYADYHLKFLESYKSNGIPIWGITTTNEPINGVFSLAKFNSLGWTIRDMGKWIAHNLGPTIRNSTFKDLKIITGDDQRMTVPFWFNVMLHDHPLALDYIDGIAVHYYLDWFVSPVVFDSVTLTHPDKFIIGTEACEGPYPWEKEKVVLGSWKRAVHYITDIIQDLSYNLIGWIDWNLCLDLTGGPNWAKNFVDSAIIVNASAKEFYKQPTFYAMGHFAKFIPRGSVRIKITKSFSVLSHLNYVAFLTPRNTIVVVIYNGGKAQDVVITCGDGHANLSLEADSVTTFEMLEETCS